MAEEYTYKGKVLSANVVPDGTNISLLVGIYDNSDKKLHEVWVGINSDDYLADKIGSVDNAIQAMIDDYVVSHIGKPKLDHTAIAEVILKEKSTNKTHEQYMSEIAAKKAAHQ